MSNGRSGRNTMSMEILFTMILPVHGPGSILIFRDPEESMLLRTLIHCLVIISISKRVCLNIILLLLVHSVSLWTAWTWIFTSTLQSSMDPKDSNPLKTFLIPPGWIHFLLIPCSLMHSCHLMTHMNFSKDIVSGWKCSGKNSQSLMIQSIISIQNGSNCPNIKKILPGGLKFKIFYHIRVASANSIQIAGIHKQFTNS